MNHFLKINKERERPKEVKRQILQLRNWLMKLTRNSGMKKNTKERGRIRGNQEHAERRGGIHVTFVEIFGARPEEDSRRQKSKKFRQKLQGTLPISKNFHMYM